MGRNKQEIPVGTKHGRLTIVKEVTPRVYQYENYKTTTRVVEVKCDCGTTTEVIYNHIKAGGIQSCGCFRSDKLKERFNDYRKTKNQN